MNIDQLTVAGVNSPVLAVTLTVLDKKESLKFSWDKSKQVNERYQTKLKSLSQNIAHYRTYIETYWVWGSLLGYLV